ncbi:hypothetical protein [Listeria phage vB_Lmo_3274]
MNAYNCSTQNQLLISGSGVRNPHNPYIKTA